MEYEQTITIHVDSRGHANLDSLPFRYGFYFSANSTITLTNCKNWTQSSIQKSSGKEEERFVLDAEFVKPEGTSDYGRFVLANHGFELMNLVTVFKHDGSTEKNLSDHLRKARKEGSLTPEDLVELHPYYVSGKARSVAGLIGTIKEIEASKTELEREQKTAAEASFDKVVSIAKRQHQEKIIAEEEADIHRQKRELAEQEITSERLARIEAENLAKQAHKKNAALEEQIKSISRSHPQYDGSDIEISRVARLLGAEKRKRTKANGQTIDCVFLSFEGNHPERKMDEVFDPQDLIFNKAKSLIGEMVVTSTWKPEIFRATHWFRDVFLWKGGFSSSQHEQIFDKPQKVDEKTYLNCPFAEKDECKALGGQWDANVKKWFITHLSNAEDFKRWLPTGFSHDKIMTQIDATESTTSHEVGTTKFPLGKDFLSPKSFKIYGPPGTGKTTTLIKEVEKAVRRGVQPESIAFFSFSNEAANVAKQRVSDEFDELGSGAFPYFSTIHSFATKLGGTHGKKLCQAEDMAKFDSGVQCSTEWTTPGDPSSIVFRYTHPILDVYSLAVARQVEVQFEQPAKQRDRLSSRKALSEYFKIKLPSTYEQIEAFWATNYKNLCQQYLQAFLLFKENQKIITFDDVINNITSDNFPDGNIPTFDLLIIDEAQDLSIHLWKLALRLIKNADVSLIAGDDDQAIMSGIGASPETFVSLKTSEPDNVLEQSWRIPQTVFDYVNVSVMPFLQDMPGRAEKPWLARSHKGETISAIKQKASGQEDVSVVYADLCLMDLINEVRLEFLNFRGDSSAARELSNAMNIQATSVDQKKCNEPPDWLIMSPTRASARAVSEALEEYGIPHFFRNKPVLDAVPNSCSIRVQTIHISKGAEAENTAIFVNSFGDVAMLADDPRLAYVAQTRAKERMFPRVIKSGLIGDMTGASANFSRAAYKFNKMFPKTLNTSPPDKLQMTSDGFFRDMNIPFEGLTDDEKDAW